MSQNNRRSSSQSSKWIGIVLVLLFTQPLLVIPLAIFGAIIYLVVQAVKKSQNDPKPTVSRTSRQQETFDDSPQSLFCFHRDKGEHHVKRGKEIDPWDRPDIDISKYQRRQ